jgi:hypothetical protein
MTQLSEYFRAQAEWRHGKAEEYPEDERNAQSATALDALAEYVEADGQHEGVFASSLTPHLFEEFSLGGEETRHAVSRYGFGHGVSTLHHIEFLGELAVTCLVDAYEHAREVKEGDPTGTLLDFEVQAACDDVFLPRRYFERRSGSTEPELQEAVTAYRGEES